MAANDALFILVAPYESVAEASTDLAVLAALYAEPPAARTLDAVAVVRDAYGQVLLVEQPQGHRVRRYACRSASPPRSSRPSASGRRSPCRAAARRSA